uniref:Pyrroline-5-carboxylate reductase n=1 Tax=Ciona savignyi TaxID=51511 RepID=H2Z5R7_CIOSA
MENKVGFIGGGEMAYAVAMGMLKGGLKPASIHVSNPSPGKLERYKKEGMNTTSDNIQVLQSCNIIILCVKPQIFPTLMKEMKTRGFKSKNQLIISVIAGLTNAKMEEIFPDSRVIRTMPNTPCLVQSGVFLYSAGSSATPADVELLLQLISPCGECISLAEHLIDAAQSICGCGPAYIYTAMDALADGGVKMGLPRALSIKLAAQAFVGAGKMHLETGLHPGVLKDAVTSPGGVTICALHELDKAGFRAALINAVTTATNRSIEMRKYNE